VAKIVIIGAGLTGLSTAYHLEKRGFFDYELFEKEATIGGLCRSIMQDGFTFDFTGHLLHISDPYFRSLISHLIGLQNFNSITRKSFIYSNNTYTHYPFQTNLYGLPPKVIAECIEGYVNRPQARKKACTFTQWAISNFGHGLANHFFLPYQTKIFACNVNRISASWTGRFVPKTSLRDMIIGAVLDNKDAQVGYNAQFFYPKQGGIESWVSQFAAHISKPIHTGYCVKNIDLTHRMISFDNSHTESFENLITTIPLDSFIRSCKEKPHMAFHQALHGLKCNSVLNFNLGIARPNISDNHWVYFPEKKYPFYRIGFPHNFADNMAPQGCSSLYGESSYIRSSKKRKGQLLAESIAHTKKLLGLADHEIITEKIMDISHAYVLYNFWREKNLKKLLNRLEQEHIYSIGRYGAWKYASMQEAILDGKHIAETITILPAKPEYYDQRQKKDTVQREVS
jgi:protoporphyrinogen oxidase